MKSLRPVLILSVCALLLTACKTVEPEAKENRLQGYVVPQGPGAFWGRVLLSGKAPAEQEINLPGGATGRDAGPLMTRRFVTDDDGGLANVFVHVSRGLENRRFDTLAEPVVIESSGYGFVPLVAGVQKGHKVIWKSSDKIGFSVASHPKAAGNRPFEYALWPNVTVETSYRSPELFLRHASDLAPGIEAFVCVVDHPYFAVTDEHGMFALPGGLEPGRYTLSARHAFAGEASGVVVIGNEGNARVEFELGAPGSGIANRVKLIDSMGGRRPQIVGTQPVRVNPVGAFPGVSARRPTQPAVLQAPRRPTPSVRQGVASTRLRPPSVSRGPQLVRRPVDRGIQTRVFHVNADRLLKGLRESYMDNRGDASLHSLFSYAIGKGFNPESGGDSFPSVALNKAAGVLQVRAPTAEMERIESLIKVLDQAPAQVAIDARILEVDVRDFDRYIATHPVHSQTLNRESFVGILTEPEFREMLGRLSEMKGARLIHAPGVATLSGRKAEIRFDKMTKLDIDPTISPDRQSVEMEVLFATFAGDSKEPTQSLKTTARSMNRQTVMLGGLAKSTGRFSSRDRTVMLLLITPEVLAEK